MEGSSASRLWVLAAVLAAFAAALLEDTPSRVRAPLAPAARYPVLEPRGGSERRPSSAAPRPLGDAKPPGTPAEAFPLPAPATGGIPGHDDPACPPFHLEIDGACVPLPAR